jgi:hypothetical protein
MEPEIDPDYFQKLIPATISLIVTGLASVLIGIYFEKFRNKTVFLKYKLFIQPLATTSKNDHWGEISVLHNQRVVNHLSFFTATVKNDSNHDIENLNLDTWVDIDSQFLAIKGNYDETGNLISHEDSYQKRLNDVLTRNEADMATALKIPAHQTPVQLLDDIRWVMTNKKFHLPVLNRRTSLTFNFLIENMKGLQPQFRISILHKSVKLILEEDEEIERKRTLAWMLGLGVVVFAIGFSILMDRYTSSKTALILCAILGLTYSLIGLGLYQLGRFFRRLFW